MRVRGLLPVVIVAMAVLAAPSSARAVDGNPPVGTLEIENGVGYTHDRTLALDVPAEDDVGVVTVLAGLWGLFEPWAPVAAGDLLMLAAAGACMASGYLCIAIAMRTGEMSAVIPFRYCGLLFACALGFLVWGEIPNLLAWVGMGLLVLAGVWIATRG